MALFDVAADSYARLMGRFVERLADRFDEPPVLLGAGPDPVAVIREVARAKGPGGRVTACAWDHAGGCAPSSGFWDVVWRYDPAVDGEGEPPGSAAGDLTRILTEAGLREIEETRLTVELVCATFAEWWHPYTLGVGPAGAYVARLNQIERAGLADALHERYGDGPVTIQASAWTATGVV